MIDNEEKIIDKIKKLLDKASNTDSLAEKETFTLNAQKLLQKYNLEMSQVERHVIDKKQNIVEVLINIQEVWENILLNTISKNNFCQSVALDEEQIIVIGKSHNLEVAIYLFSFFKRAALDLCLSSYTNEFNKKAEQLKAIGGDINVLPQTKFKNKFMRNYLMGVVQGIGTKLNKQKAEAQKESSTLTSLIVLNDNAIEKYVKEIKRWNLKEGKKTKIQTDNNAYKKGHEDGQNIHVYEGVEAKKSQSKYLN